MLISNKLFVFAFHQEYSGKSLEIVIFLRSEKTDIDFSAFIIERILISQFFHISRIPFVLQTYHTIEIEAIKLFSYIYKLFIHLNSSQFGFLQMILIPNVFLFFGFWILKEQKFLCLVKN